MAREGFERLQRVAQFGGTDSRRGPHGKPPTPPSADYFPVMWMKMPEFRFASLDRNSMSTLVVPIAMT